MRKIIQILVLTVLGSTLGFAQSSLPAPLGTYAQGIDGLTLLLLGISAFFVLLITVLLVSFMIRFRARKKDGEGEKIHGNTKLEVLWTVIPFILMVILGILAWGPMAEQLAPPKDALVIKITGYAFDWDFEYFQTVSNSAGTTEETFDFICGDPKNFIKVRSLGVKTTHILRLPVNKPVRFIITATDVLHSWWIPEMRFKRDAVPNYFSDGWMKPDRIGTFIAKCAELCGSDHALMQARVEVIPLQDFELWLTSEQLKQAAAAPAPRS